MNSVTATTAPVKTAQPSSSKEPPRPTDLPVRKGEWPVAKRRQWRGVASDSKLNRQMVLLLRDLERVRARLDEFSAVDVYYEMENAARMAGFTEADIASDEMQDEIGLLEHLTQSAIGLLWCLDTMIVQLDGAVTNEKELEREYAAKEDREKKLAAFARRVLKRRRERKAREQAAGVEPAVVVAG